MLGSQNMLLNEKNIAHMFDKISYRYDFLNSFLSLKQDRRWRKHLISQINPEERGIILDVATGTGDVLKELMDSSQFSFEQYIGVDISTKMLDLADKKLANHESSSCYRLLEMSAESLHITDSLVDCLTISFGLRNVCDRVKALNEFHRVLKPNGQLLILEFFSPNSSFSSYFFSLYLNKILPLIGGVLSDKSAYKYLSQSIASFESPVRLRKILSDCGFKVNKEKKFLFGTTRIFSCQKL